MIYSIKARFIKGKMNKFYQKLTDGTIKNQKPDGQEIINSMKRAKITGPDLIQWSEMCFCSPPLKHERETVYNNFLTDFGTGNTCCETDSCDSYHQATYFSLSFIQDFYPLQKTVNSFNVGNGTRTPFELNSLSTSLKAVPIYIFSQSIIC